MFILALETTGFHCSVALLNEEKIIEKHSENKLSHLRDLSPLIEEVLKEGMLELKDIDALAVSLGPGSFTGIRIGVSTARAMAQVLGTRCIGVDSMEAMALSGQQESIKNLGFNEKTIERTLVCPLVDARQEQVYGCLRLGNNQLVPTFVKTIRETLEEIKKVVEEKAINQIVFLGDGVEKYREQIIEFEKTLENKNVKVSFSNACQNAGSVAKLAFLNRESGLLSYDQLLPNYMRKPEAQRRLEERLK